MNVFELEKLLFEWSPKSYAEDFDNVGLLVGNGNDAVAGVVITLDCTEKVIQEAIDLKANVIVTFHPIIFSGLKSITGKNYVEKIVLKAIKNDISIIAIHTNLDNSSTGVNYEICNRLQLINQKIFIPKEKQILKLSTYVPKTHIEKVKEKLFDSGAGNIGNYSECSFSYEGTGTFNPKEKANPFIGKKHQRENVAEICLNVIFEDYLKNKIISALMESHPYEEVAYDIFRLENQNQEVGIGRVGELERELSESQFLEYVKKHLPTKCIRHSKLLNKKVKKIAVLGGSGSFAISNAIHANADVYITADLKYHDFFRAENKIVLMDIGHYESEQFTKNLIYDYLMKKNSIFALHISKENTNPVNYF
ncbi:MAG: Nif3-like dinuclear metal center hexameric protein [Flavobacteriales bacterium]|nr:Nif3-like dinuclear metal center hexameric protein [Flavobacteriales bacterium]